MPYRKEQANAQIVSEYIINQNEHLNLEFSLCIFVFFFLFHYLFIENLSWTLITDVSESSTYRLSHSINLGLITFSQIYRQ